MHCSRRRYFTLSAAMVDAEIFFANCTQDNGSRAFTDTFRIPDRGGTSHATRW